jgi:hypothetical protein
MKPGFYGPRSRANARLLIDTATALGYPTSVVKTTRSGYTAPEDVIQAILGVSGIEEGVTYPAPAEVAPAGAQTLERPNNGASRAEWVAYAESVGIEVTADDNRNGLVKKVDALEEGTD